MHFFNAFGILVVPLTVRFAMAHFNDNYAPAFFFIAVMMLLPGLWLLNLPTPI
jgi:hypothetical protein